MKVFGSIPKHLVFLNVFCLYVQSFKIKSFIEELSTLTNLHRHKKKILDVYTVNFPKSESNFLSKDNNKTIAKNISTTAPLRMTKVKIRIKSRRLNYIIILYVLYYHIITTKVVI